MTVMFTDRERAALSRRLRERNIPDWQEFITNWISYNTLYNAVAGTTERDRLMNLILQFLDPTEAVNILSRLNGPMTYFSTLPPGDTRKHSTSPGFRSRSSADMQVVNDVSIDPAQRLARLMAVTYQIRCNLLHGDKDPTVKRDRELVSQSNQVLNQVLPVLTAAMEK